MKQFLILTEAGDNIGFGHYTRCSAIQDLLNQHGVACKILLNLKGAHQLPLDGEIVNWQNDKVALEKWKMQGYSSVLVDSYMATEKDFTVLRSLFNQLIVLDDYNRIAYEADILINPNIAAADIDYANQKATIYGGKDFVILRSVFRQGRISILEDQVKHIVITVGGSDYRNLMPQIISIVQKTLNSCKISVIAGSPDLQESLKSKFPSVNILGLLSAQEMLSIFQAGDIVISACGQSLHELASIGMPTVGICLDVDQVPNQNYYNQIGFIQPKIHYTNLSPISQELLKLQSKVVRKQRQQIGLQAINIKGVENICKVLTTDFSKLSMR